ncbi:hypothetical protein N7530_009673 [Penicillium desertorum]|uniref:Uncharacterized protein n=1 Tax=Penicillium desertorum TaxID=1303715 RepID=A0A9W9WJ29_9EURO|nr:hypothetical protein N7530_009673 [Penicillium desertorum]
MPSKTPALFAFVRREEREDINPSLAWPRKSRADLPSWISLISACQTDSGKTRLRRRDCELWTEYFGPYKVQPIRQPCQLPSLAQTLSSKTKFFALQPRRKRKKQNTQDAETHIDKKHSHNKRREREREIYME